jgi:hypothetical protein
MGGSIYTRELCGNGDIDDELAVSLSNSGRNVLSVSTEFCGNDGFDNGGFDDGGFDNGGFDNGGLADGGLVDGGFADGCFGGDGGLELESLLPVTRLIGNLIYPPSDISPSYSR